MADRVRGRAFCTEACPFRPHAHFSDMLGRFEVTGRPASRLWRLAARVWGV